MATTEPEYMTQTVPVDVEAALSGYLDGASEFEAAVLCLDQAALDVAPAPGAWTARQIVHHVVDGDVLWAVCIKMALGGSQVAFSLPWYWDKEQDQWAHDWGYDRRAVAPSLALLRAHHEHVVQLIRAVPGAWQRPIQVCWPDGTMQAFTPGAVVEMHTGHVLQHLDEIRRIQELCGPGTGRSDDQPQRYEIRVQGVLDSHWSAWFDDFAISRRPGKRTQLTGVVPDQAALHGLLAKIRNLGLPLISVRRIE
jgi:hypothetical protein